MFRFICLFLFTRYNHKRAHSEKYFKFFRLSPPSTMSLRGTLKAFIVLRSTTFTWVPNSCSSLWIRVSWHFSEQITCPGGHEEGQIKQKICMRSVNSKFFSGECCRPWSKGEETWEQEPAWPRHDVLPATISRYPGSQVSIRPLALP